MNNILKSIKRLYRGIAQLVERRPLESDVGGSNPSTPATPSNVTPYNLELCLSVDLWNGHGQLKVNNLSSVRIKCIECGKMSGIITILCWDEGKVDRMATAYRVACPKCNTMFKFILNPVRCLSCNDPDCDELPAVRFWEN